ncbi:MAG: putative zinc metalloprotease [Candidatus Hydrogenedentes bacterium ADurb.Bin179]|nr:MAG: putative zinc metalloprotease [Candidatus Hydrogenedentes bacterium ADurb.Bin179]
MLINILVFVVVLSLLIFFHELGHFLAAKAFGIYVKRFSIGMPPRLFGFQWGETDYCVGALPLGGFVMMAGQEDVPLTDEEREEQYGGIPEERWFNKKPVLQRMGVLLAGPFMNLVLAMLLYAIVGLVGSYVPEWEVEARVGDIEENAPVLEAPLYLAVKDQALQEDAEPAAIGWQIGDRILSVNGRDISNMTDLAIAAVLGGDTKSHEILLERTDHSGATVQFLSRVTPQVLDETGHARFGVGPYETALVQEVLPGSPAEASGFQEGDIIQEVNGKPVSLPAFIKYVEDTGENQEISVTIQRAGQILDVKALPKTIGRIRDISFGNPEDENGQASILGITKAVSERTHLKPGDVLLEANGEPVTAKELQQIEESAPGTTVELAVLRPAKFFGLIQEELRFKVPVEVAAVRAIGVALHPRSVLQRVPPSRIIQHASYQSYLAVERTVQTIVGLFQRTVSPKDLGGPLMIYEVTTKAARAGLDWLFKITAFISVNLFILNLLPLPVLDGGQVVMNALEALRGKPLNTKFLERLQQVGILLLIALMLYVTYNDIERKILDLFF